MHEHQALADRRRGDHFVADLRLPLLGAGGGIERDHVAFEAADHDQAVARARAAGQAAGRTRNASSRRAGLQVERAHAALDRGGVHAAVGDRRALAHAEPAFALAGAARTTAW